MGRRHELAQLRSELGRHRLVTLIGPGGVGKTRLAFRAARDLEKSEFPDGVWSVELAAIHDEELVLDAVAGAVGLSDREAGHPLERLALHLGEQEVLLVLDNCEQVQDAAAVLADQLLTACPRLRLIATSRHELGVEGECLLPVPPLSVPDDDREDRSPTGLLHYDSVRLFVERASASAGDFEVTAENQRALARLLRGLEGLPLAIELAAVRVRSLSVQEILDRLDHRFGLLNRGATSSMERHRTLTALIDWSYDLLDPLERLVWSRAAVLGDTFDAAAAAAVVADERLPAQAVEGLLTGLVGKSVLRRADGPMGPRFRMLDSIREYGQTRLEASGEAEVVGERQRAYFAEVAAHASVTLYGAHGVEVYQRLGADHDNLRLALERCAGDPEHAAAGLQMMGQLQHYWVMAGRFSEGRLWSHRLLERSQPASTEHATGLEVAGRLAVLQGDKDVGRRLLEQALAEAEQVGSRSWQAHALHGLALTEAFWGDPSAAVPLLLRARDLHREEGDPFGFSLALVQLATVHATLGEPELAMAFAEQCIAEGDSAGEKWCVALARWTQALILWRQGRVRRVRSFARDVLRIKQPFGDRMGMAMSIEVLAWTACEENKHAHAATLLGAVDIALTSIGGSLFGYLQSDHDACVTRCRSALGEEVFRARFDEGRDLDFDDAVELALGRRRSAGPATPATPAARGAAGAPERGAVRLTRREQEIALLVAEGRSNREIAETLVVAVRTAEGHVARILAKLGLHGREQVAAFLAESGGHDDPG